MWRLVSPTNNLGYERATLATPLTLHPASSQLAGSFVPVRRTARKQIASRVMARRCSLAHRHTQPAYLQDPTTSNFDRAHLSWPAKTGRGSQSPWCSEDVFRPPILRPIHKPSAATTMSLADVCQCFKHHPELGAGEADVISKSPRLSCPITTPPGQASGMSNLELFKLYHMCTKTPPSPSRHPQRHHTSRFNDLHSADLCISARFGNLNHALSALKRQCSRHLLCPSRWLLHSCRTREPPPSSTPGQPCSCRRHCISFSCASQPLCSRRRPNAMAATSLDRKCVRHGSRRLHTLCTSFISLLLLPLLLISPTPEKRFNCPWTVKHACL
jgi:hypothetical protein